MEQMEFERGLWTVTYRGITVTLLPKEFLLLEHLYRNESRTLTRDQLLDSIWQMEAPTDRTVDDHVYRIRKKLNAWKDSFEIVTVRNAGYRLVRKSSQNDLNPLSSVPAYTDSIRDVMSTNRLYGRGDALLTLAKHHEVFGFEMDASTRLFLSFIKGDFVSLVRSEAPFAEKAYYLLHLLHAADAERSRPYVEEIIRRRCLSAPWRDELERYNLIAMRMDWGENESAKTLLDTALEETERDASTQGLIPYLSNLLLEFWIRTGDWSAAEKQMLGMEKQLSQFPYLREEGRYHILRGIVIYRKKPKEGVASLDRGLGMLRRSRFVPHWMVGLDAILAFAGTDGIGASLKERYKPEWDRLVEQTRLLSLQGEIETLLRIKLYSF